MTITYHCWHTTCVCVCGGVNMPTKRWSCNHCQCVRQTGVAMGGRRKGLGWDGVPISPIVAIRIERHALQHCAMVAYDPRWCITVGHSRIAWCASMVECTCTIHSLYNRPANHDHNPWASTHRFVGSQTSPSHSISMCTGVEFRDVHEGYHSAIANTTHTHEMCTCIDTMTIVIQWKLMMMSINQVWTCKYYFVFTHSRQCAVRKTNGPTVWSIRWFAYEIYQLKIEYMCIIVCVVNYDCMHWYECMQYAQWSLHTKTVNMCHGVACICDGHL